MMSVECCGLGGVLCCVVGWCELCVGGCPLLDGAR